jgi:hypothetical protein
MEQSILTIGRQVFDQDFCRGVPIEKQKDRGSTVVPDEEIRRGQIGWAKKIFSASTSVVVNKKPFPFAIQSTETGTPSHFWYFPNGVSLKAMAKTNHNVHWNCEIGELRSLEELVVIYRDRSRVADLR